MQVRARAIVTLTRGCIVVGLAAGLVTGCGSSSAPPTLATGGGGGAQSQAPALSLPPAPSAAQGGGGGGGGGGSAADVEAIGKALIPPNSTEVSKTTVPDTWFVVYSSTDSVDSLKSYYEGAISKTGLQIISTTTLQGGVSWVIAQGSNSNFGGAVSVFPSGDGKTVVQVTVGKS
jgi:hypothetical protein